MAKKGCFLHIWPYWPPAVFCLAFFALTIYVFSIGDTMSFLTLALVPLLLFVFIQRTRTMSFYPDKLVLRVLGIPYRTIALSQVDSFVLVPTYRGHRRQVPPTAAAVLKPGTAESYCNERGLKRTQMVNCPHVSVYFNWRQSYAIWATLEANGIRVIEFDDVGDF